MGKNKTLSGLIVEKRFALYIALHALLVATDIDNFEKVENRAERSCNNDDTKHAAVAHQFSNFISHFFFFRVVVCRTPISSLLLCRCYVIISRNDRVVRFFSSSRRVFASFFF